MRAPGKRQPGLRPAAARAGLSIVLLSLVIGCTQLDQLRRPVSAENRVAELIKRDPSPAATSQTADGQTAQAPQGPEGTLINGGSGQRAQPVRVFGQDAPPSTQPTRAQIRPTGGQLVVNFENADLREVVRLILGETLGVNYLFDPRVSGQVSLETTRPLDADALLAVLETVLGLNGAALIATDDDTGVLYRIVPLSDALLSDIRPVVAPAPVDTGAGYQVRVAPLAFLPASEMAEILRPFLPDGGILRIDEERNLLILAGSGPDIRRAVETIAVFDVDVLRGKSVGVFPVENTRAETLVPELRRIFGERSDPAGGPDTGFVTFEAIERMNAVLVISPRSTYLRQAEEWIERLDQGGEAGRGLYVYPVQHGKASDLARVLNGLYGGATGIPAETAAADTAPSALSALAPGDLAPLGSTAGTEPSPAPPFTADQPAAAAEGARFIADEVNNALLILATAEEYRRISAALRKLDIEPVQVLIEATVAEVTLTDALRFGVQFFLEDEILGINVASQLTRGESVGGVSPQLPGYQLSLGSPIKVILDALDGVTDVNVISSPHLMVLDNQTAELNVGAEVPVARQQRQGTNEDDSLINTIEFRDTGVILRVTPRVNNAGSVSMDIEQEVSSVASQDAETLTPTFTTRRFTSKVLAQDGATVVLGGLFQDQSTRTKSGIPVLQDAPLVGALFGSRGLENTRTELLVMITPRIVRGAADAENAARDLQTTFQRAIQGAERDTPLRRSGSLIMQ
ncbi:MAG: type II secretion system secretin GspD [Pseudomonadota bacterium]